MQIYETLTQRYHNMHDFDLENSVFLKKIEEIPYMLFLEQLLTIYNDNRIQRVVEIEQRISAFLLRLLP